MGMWDVQPWDNDTAADWYAGVFKSSNLRAAWLEGIDADPEDDGETVRAAAWLILQLGRVYVWPIEHLDEDLKRTAEALALVRDSDDVAEVPELVEAITAEVAELESRLKPRDA